MKRFVATWIILSISGLLSAPLWAEEAIYHGIRPNFVVNVSSDTGTGRYLLLQVDLSSRNQEVIDAVKEHDLMIKDRLNAFLLTQKVENLKTMEHKEALRQSILDIINQVLTEAVGFQGVDQVLFTEFILE